MNWRHLVPTLTAALAWGTFPADAIVFYGLGNDANTTDPGTGVPWSSVARVIKSDSNPAGSAVHLGVFYYSDANPALSGWKSYLLTADHVAASGGKVSFDNSIFHDVKSATQVAAGVDLKILRLDVALNTVPAVSLYSGSSDLDEDSVLVGWGIGQSGKTGDTVNWGFGTVAHRWGDAKTEAVSVTLTSGSYSYTALVTQLRKDAGAAEAGATYFDSGGGLFQKHGDTWYLVGTTTTVETLGSSTFGTIDTNSDSNYFARISTYKSALEGMLPVPEPATLALLSGLGLLGFAVVRRWRQREPGVMDGK